MALWTPSNLAVAPVEWFKGDAGVTGSPVSAWANQGTNGGLQQNTVGQRPAITNTLNSLPVLSFTGSGSNGEWLANSSTRTYSSGKLYIFVVAKRTSSATDYTSMVFGGSSWSSSNGWAFQFNSSGDGKPNALRAMGGNGYGGNAPDAISNNNATGYNDGYWHIFETGLDTAPNISVDATAQTLQTQLTGSSVPTLTGVKFNVAANDGANNNGDKWNGDIAEIVILDYRPTSDELAKIQGYLAWKWGNTGATATDLVGKLPIGHAYKSAAPTTGDISVSVTGVSATSAVGDETVSGKASTVATGSAATSAVGDETVAAKAVTIATGVASTGSVGTVTVQISGTFVNVTGSEVTAAAGTIDFTETVYVSGLGMSAVSGSAFAITWEAIIPGTDQAWTPEPTTTNNWTNIVRPNNGWTPIDA